MLGHTWYESSMPLEAYMDESGTDDRSPLLAVAGYVFWKPQAKKFRRQWISELATSSEGKPTKAQFFRMSDCAHGEGQFAGWSVADRTEIEKRLIKHIRKRTEFGFAVTLNEDEYNDHLAGRHGMPSAYAFACFACLGMVRRWLERNQITDDVRYIFESGHEHERNASGFLNEVFSVGRARADYHYAGHSFSNKDHAPPLQAGDMLAWHAIKNRLRELAGKEPRKDLIALVREDVDRYRHYDLPAMHRLATALQERGIPHDDKPFKARRAMKRTSRTAKDGG